MWTRLRWYGHGSRRTAGVEIRQALAFEKQGVTGRGRPRLGWIEQAERQSDGRLKDNEESNRRMVKNAHDKYTGTLNTRHIGQILDIYHK